MPHTRSTERLLTPEQVDFFDANGYLVLPRRIPPELLHRLQEAATTWIAEGRAAGDGAPDYLFADRPSGRVMFRVDYVHAKGQAASLELLGSPEVLSIAESLAGPDFVPTYESLVFKDEGDGAPITWHQDAVHPRRHRIFNIDVYLDASLPGQGPLKVVPGSQRAKIDACAVADTYGWDVPGAVEVAMEPGDVLVHDVMVVHGSMPTEGNALRRTLYYEFRSAQQILEEGPWDRSWVDARLRLLPLALAAHAEAFPDQAGFAWTPPAHLRPTPAGSTAEELRIVHQVHTPGSFCSAGDVPI
ncbi:MAG TPA: phytanoyl-CoA dioxygenase family protein [Candidatus Limnocylindria bacterium]|nr:phytanoyl-CoA dioxygenase family protein [Candidatus Limnocylindria bacterium]